MVRPSSPPRPRGAVFSLEAQSSRTRIPAGAGRPSMRSVPSILLGPTCWGVCLLWAEVDKERNSGINRTSTRKRMAASSMAGFPGRKKAKRKSGRARAALPEVYSESCSELEFHGEPRVERVLEIQWRQEIGVGEWGLEAEIAVLITQRHRAHGVSDVEQVGQQVNRPTFRQLVGVFRVEVDSARERHAPLAATAADGHFALVAVHRVVGKFTDRRSAEGADAGPQRQALESAVLPGIAAEEVDDLMPFCVQRADSKLVAQKAHHALGEIKQRADTRVGLAVVIAERAFVVSAQIG